MFDSALPEVLACGRAFTINTANFSPSSTIYCKNDVFFKLYPWDDLPVKFERALRPGSEFSAKNWRGSGDARDRH